MDVNKVPAARQRWDAGSLETKVFSCGIVGVFVGFFSFLYATQERTLFEVVWHEAQEWRRIHARLLVLCVVKQKFEKEVFLFEVTWHEAQKWRRIHDCWYFVLSTKSLKKKGFFVKDDCMLVLWL